MKKVKRIALIGLLFIVVIASLAAIITTAPETKRCETEFLATTEDNVTIKIRAFGDCLKEADINKAITQFKDEMRNKVGKLKHSDIANKLKLQFRELVNNAEERGLSIDSLSQSEPKDAD